MCMKTTCKVCKKSTWAGCGRHIDAALQGVPESDRCGGWKTGKCTMVADATEPVKTPCSSS